MSRTSGAADTHSCDPCDWCDDALGWSAWRPVRLPRRGRGARARPRPAVEQVRQSSAEPEHPQSPAKHEPERSASTAKPAAGAACRPQRARAGRALLRRALARASTAIWLGHRPRHRRRGPRHRAHRPGPRARAPPRRRRPVAVRARGRDRRRRLVGSCPAASWRSPAPSSRARSARSAGWCRWSLVLVGWRDHARPGAQRAGRPPGDRLGRVQLRRARHRAHRQRQPAAGQRRHHAAARGRRSGRLRRRPACCSTCSAP